MTLRNCESPWCTWGFPEITRHVVWGYVSPRRKYTAGTEQPNHPKERFNEGLNKEE